VPVPVDRHHPVSFGKPLSIFAEDVGQVGERGELVLGDAHGTVDRDLARVEESRSCPRTTWVIFISTSSTATASVYSGDPSARTSTKSGTCALSTVTSPRTRSVNVVDPAGIRNLTAGLRPSA